MCRTGSIGLSCHSRHASTREEKAEKCDPSQQEKAGDEPLIRCLHGGPGTGKSFVLQLSSELFTEVLGWVRGADFQKAALQATMAEQIGGDTIHHALGINPFGQKGSDAKERQKQSAVAERVLQWRWLIIDEIIMVSSQLLAEMDMKLRDVVRKVGSMKHESLALIEHSVASM